MLRGRQTLGAHWMSRPFRLIGVKVSPNPRVHEIATSCGVDSRTALRILKEMGEFVKGPSSSLNPPTARRLRLALEAEGYRAGTEPAKGTSTPLAPRPRSAPPRALVDGNPFSRPNVVDTPAEAENRAWISAVFGIRPENVKLQRERPRASRKTDSVPASKTDVEWASYIFDRAERDAWVAAGIGEENARLAAELRQRGIEPRHLRQKIDGRTVAERLRGGDSFDRIVLRVKQDIA